MSEDSHDNAVMVQGDVGETMRIEEEQKEAEKEQKEQGKGKEVQTDEELKERVISGQEEKGKGEKSAAEDITDSELPTSRQRIKKKAKAGKQKEPNLYNLSKQLERYTKQLSNIESTVQQFPKYLKNTVIQSSILNSLILQ